MLVNPISFRLSVSTFWDSGWNIYNNSNYKYLFYSDLLFFEFFMFFLKNAINMGYFDCQMTHIRLFRWQDKILVNYYYHIANEDLFEDVSLEHRFYIKRKVVLKNKKITKNLKQKKVSKKLIKNLIRFLETFVLNALFLKQKKVKLNDSNLIKFMIKNFFESQWKLKIKNILKRKIKPYFHSFIKKDFLNFLKEYYVKMSKNYVNFFCENLTLIKEFHKSKKVKVYNRLKIKKTKKEKKQKKKKKVKNKKRDTQRHYLKKFMLKKKKEKKLKKTKKEQKNRLKIKNQLRKLTDIFKPLENVETVAKKLIKTRLRLRLYKSLPLLIDLTLNLKDLFQKSSKISKKQIINSFNNINMLKDIKNIKSCYFCNKYLYKVEKSIQLLIRNNEELSIKSKNLVKVKKIKNDIKTTTTKKTWIDTWSDSIRKIHRLRKKELKFAYKMLNALQLQEEKENKGRPKLYIQWVKPGNNLQTPQITIEPPKTSKIYDRPAKPKNNSKQENQLKHKAKWKLENQRKQENQLKLKTQWNPKNNWKIKNTKNNNVMLMKTPLIAKKSKKNKKKKDLDSYINYIKPFIEMKDIYKKIQKIKSKILFFEDNNFFMNMGNVNVRDKKLKKKLKNKKITYYNFLYNKKPLLFLYKQMYIQTFFNSPLYFYNIYFYFLSKMLQNETQIFFGKWFRKLELNIYRVTFGFINAQIVSDYISQSLHHNYNIYETMRPVLIDFKERMKIGHLAGFKMAISGRFKRALRATYWWRKDAHLFTSKPTAAIDYGLKLHRTKYGICMINVWLTAGPTQPSGHQKEYPSSNPFFFLLKQDKLLNAKYFLLKRNDFFMQNLLIHTDKLNPDFELNFYKGLILCFFYKYMYIHIFLSNISIKPLTKNNNKINKNLTKIFLPQYCLYKIQLEDFIQKNCIKIIPFIQLKLLKRINLRNSYKVNFLNKASLFNLRIFKYRINLK